MDDDLPDPVDFPRRRSLFRTLVEHRRHHGRNHLEPPFREIPSFGFYASHTSALDRQVDFLSSPLHDARLTVSPVSDSDVDYESEAEFYADTSSEGEGEQDVVVDDLDFDVYEDDDHVSFITDLFERPTEDSNLDLGLTLGLGQLDEDMDDWDDSNYGIMDFGIEGNDEVDLELGLGLGSGSAGEFDRGTCVVAEPRTSEFGSISGEGSSYVRGLREVGIDSESDSERNVTLYSQICSNFEEIDGMERISDLNYPPFCWDYLGFDEQQRNEADDFRWQDEEEDEENQQLRQLESSSVVTDHLVEDDDPLYDWYHERDENEAGPGVSYRSETDDERDIEDSLEEAFQDLEWEILLAVNNISRDLDNETMFGVVEESMNEWIGNPPAAKSVIENLPHVKLSCEDLKKNEISCPICWVEISVEEQVKALPCRHYYHGECIVPWLGLRNTCPVCRFELPTDDSDYEIRRREINEQNLQA